MSSTKRRSLKDLFTASCGCRPTPTDVVEPKPKLKPNPCVSNQKRRHCASSTSSPPKINDILAVVKDSDDPYLDFRQSMIEMMSQKEIYSTSELEQLLRCFLDLNQPHHHETIVRAFMDAWNGGEEMTAPPCSAA